MSSYSTMTDNPLVEAVSYAIQREMPGWLAENGTVEDTDLATAALRAIEDAGYEIVAKAGKTAQ